MHTMVTTVLQQIRKNPEAAPRGLTAIATYLLPCFLVEKQTMITRGIPATKSLSMKTQTVLKMPSPFVRETVA